MTYYDEIAVGYEELHREEQEKKLRIIKENLEVKKDDLLLDVGCGTGVTSNFDCNVTGLDPSSKLLEKCNLSIRLVKARAEDIPFNDNTFDIVVSVTAIQNFEDIEKGLKEIRRVGKNRFALSFLKKSPKADFIEKKIKELFKVEKRIEEDKDIIFILSAKHINK
jgi:ubiquinone/menaquinone biosynthesis C-methylase UbiE